MSTLSSFKAYGRLQHAQDNRQLLARDVNVLVMYAGVGGEQYG